MQPTTEILARISRNSLANKDEIFTRLYRYMLRSDLYFLAYKNLYANNGAATKGANDDTADGFSEAKIANIIQRLADETYQPTPVRRTYIKKKNNPKKKRPLGIPTFTDKLVQEVLRMVLEAVYEPVFLPVSHGFRPKRSCHTALKSLKMEFNGMRWFVEGDIKGCFDNIDHSVLVGLIHSKIKDARLIKLIYKFLKAGYLEDWKYHKTYSGTPQGGIISPLLANIYLHELDKFVMKLKSEFDTHGQEPVRTEYRLLSNDLQKLSYHIGRRTGAEREQLLSEYNEKRKLMLKMPCTAQTKKCIKYIRYADDFILGVKGSQEDCQWIKSKLSEFIRETLKMELSEEKTLITHSSESIGREDELGCLAQNLNSLSASLSTALNDLQIANQQLKTDIEKEQALERQRVDFFSAASHELKTPLTILKGHLAGMLNGVSGYENHIEYMERSLAVVDRMEKLVKELLYVSKAEETQKTEYKTVDFAEILRVQVAAVADLLEEKKQHLEANIPTRLYCEVEQAQMERAIQNILVNAIRYSPSGELIRISLSETHGTIRGEIENTGVRVPDDAIPHLFEAFYRADTSRNRNTGGTGLGLYIVRKVMEMHRANYGISNINNGVLFWFELPCKQPVDNSI